MSVQNNPNRDSGKCRSCSNSEELRDFPTIGHCSRLRFNVCQDEEMDCCFFQLCNSGSRVDTITGALPARSEARTESAPVMVSARAANSFRFFTLSDTGIFHQRRCSTADESGLPDYVDWNPDGDRHRKTPVPVH